MYRVVAQPFEDLGSLHEYLLEVLGDPEIQRFYAVTAWAKRSGLTRIAADLEDFKRRGGRATLLVGIDEGGATKQGLRLAVDMFHRVHLLHDRSARTFHPKLYLGVGRTRLRAYVGSSNLTAGGLYANYELGVGLYFEAGTDEYDHIRRGLGRYLLRLYTDPDTCRRLTADNVEAVIEDPGYRVSDEDSRGASPELDATTDSPTASSTNFLGFRSSRRAMKRPPPTSGRTQGSRRSPSTARRAARVASVRAGIAERWFKRLSRSDAQQARPGSNPTGNLRLAQAGHDIDHTTYFRNVMFGGEHWRKELAPNGVLDVADIPFTVRVGGRNLGNHTLRVDHANFRVANQANIATFLHWGTVAAELRRHDYTQRYVVIERLTDGSFRLSLQDAPPGSPV